MSFVIFAAVLAAASAVPASSREPSLDDVTASVWLSEGRVIVALRWPGKDRGFGCTRFRDAPKVTLTDAELIDVNLYPPRWVGIVPSRRCYNAAAFTFIASERETSRTFTIKHRKQSAALTYFNEQPRCALRNAAGDVVKQAEEGDALVLECAGAWRLPPRTHEYAYFNGQRSEVGLGRLDDHRSSFSVGQRWRGEGDVSFDHYLEGEAACTGFHCDVVRRRVQHSVPLVVTGRSWALQATPNATAELLPLWQIPDTLLRLTAAKNGTASAATTMTLPVEPGEYSGIIYRYRLKGPGALRVDGERKEPTAHDGMHQQHICAKAGAREIKVELDGRGHDEVTQAELMYFLVESAAGCP